MPASRRSRTIADVMEDDVQRIEDEARVVLLRLLNDLRPSIIRSVRRAGADLEVVLDRFNRNAEELLLDAMVANHLTGARRAIDLAAPHIARNVELSLEDRIQRLRESLNLNPVTIAQIREVYGSEARVAILEATDAAEDDIRRAANDAVREGLTTQAATQRMQEEIASAGIGPINPWRLETVFRTQQNMAYSAGMSNMERNPIIADELWGYEYVTAGDDRVRPTHVALDGIKLTKRDPRWQTLTPPNGYACRCRRIMLFRDESPTDEPPPDTAVVDGATVVPGPDVGFAFDPGEIFGVVRSSPVLRRS